MADDERLRAIIEVVDRFSAKLDELLADLEVVERQIERVDGSRITLDTSPAHAKLDALQAQMAGMQAQGAGRRLATGVGDVNLRGRGSGGGGLSLDAGEVADTLSDASRNASRLAASLDLSSDSGGRLSDMLDSITDAASSATDSMDEFDLRMTDVHNAVAQLVPLLVVFVGAMPALIGGLVALTGAAVGAAAALAAVTGLGALGLTMTSEMAAEDILTQVREDFIDAFRPLAEQLAPLFEDGLDGLESFFQALADRGDTLVRFADVARDFGRFLLDYLPGVIQALGEMAIAFHGVFAMLGDALQDANLAERLTGFMADVLPEFVLFFQLLFDIIQRLAGMSEGFLQVANVILFAVDAFLYIITVGGLLDDQMGALIATTLTLATVMLFWGSGVISGLIGRLTALGTAVLTRVIPALTSYTSSAVSSTIATYGLATAIATLIGVATLGIGAIAIGGITALANRFGVLGDNIGSATDKLRNFQRLSRGTDGDNPYGFGGSGDVSRGSTGSTATTNFDITVEGEADPDTLRNQTRNAMFRASRTNSTT
jgi:hypothetical protein